MSHLPALGHKRKVVLNRPSSSKPCTLSQLDMPPKRNKPLTTVVIDMPIEDRMATLHVTMLEKKMEQLTVDDVETVRLVLFEHDGKTYYREPSKGKLFTRLGPKSVGSYIGRWNSRENCIQIDIPDSDID